MIKSLKISNFKSFGKEHSIEFKDLTLLSGLNSSGKSSIYQVLLILTQSFGQIKSDSSDARPVLVINGSKIQVGRKEEILHDINNSKLNFEITTTKDSRLSLEYTLEKQPVDGTVYEDFVLTQLAYENKQLGSQYDLTYDNQSKQWSIFAESALEFLSPAFNRVLDKYARELSNEIGESLFSSTVEFKDIKNVQFIGFDLVSFTINVEDTPTCLETLHRNKFKLDRLKEIYLKETGKELSQSRVTLSSACKYSEINNFLNNSVIDIPPFRGHPRRFYTEGLMANPLINLNRRKNERIPYRYDFDSKEVVTGKFESALNYWMSEYFKFADGVEVNELIHDYASEIFLKVNNKQIPINNVGFGVSQILPVIFNLLQGKKDDLFIVDEPEIHLHPAIQTKLADFFVEMALIGKRIILETHSEYLINKLIFLTMKYPALKEKLALFWVERENGSSITREIKYDDLGYLREPPKDFLTESSHTIDIVNELRMKKLGE